jgi:hypothetical protein
MKRILAILTVAPFVICWIAMWVVVGLIALIIQTFTIVIGYQMDVARGEDCDFRTEWNFHYAGSVLEEAVDNILEVFGV